MTDQDFIASLKEGNKVAIESHPPYSNDISYSFQTVVKITPSGIIKTSDGKSFNKNGELRGNSYYRQRIKNPQIVRQEIDNKKAEEERDRESAINELLRTIPDLPLYKLNQILELIKGK